MTRALGTYSFLPWLRQGVARTISAADNDATVATRASIQVALALHGEPVAQAVPDEPISRNIQLYGPGDIVGIDARAVVRTEPRDWITNFEPNYVPQIEFYDEDFPWRYTPAAPDGGRLRLRPWIALVVLKEGEFDDGRNLLGKPLPYVDVSDQSIFPRADELWAWAHVHVNRTLARSDEEFVSTDLNAVLPRLRAILDENPDLAYSRLVCPRKLEEDKPYHAFVVPVYETGRLAGLGLDPALAPHATFSAWEPYNGKRDPASFPVYYRWYFRTSTQGDFEYLVRLLEPRPVDPRVGRRELDVLDPGSNIPPIDDPDLHGVLRLGGALRVPRISLSEEERTEADRYENWAQPYPKPFQEALAAFVNLADAYSSQSAESANASAGVTRDPDPLVVPPLYLRWHALAPRVLRNRNGSLVPNSSDWLHELNLDPRHRVSAAFGTRVVQENQEDYVNAAWEQIGDVLEANRRIRAAQLAKEVSSIWYERHLGELAVADAERAFVLLAPVQRHMLASGRTIQHRRSESLVQPALTSVAHRRATRPGGILARSLPAAAPADRGRLLARVNVGEVAAAPPKSTPTGVSTTDQVADSITPSVPAALLAILRRFPWLPYALVVVALLVGALLLLFLPLGLGAALAAVVVAGLVAVAVWLGRIGRAIRRADTVREENLTTAAVDALPASPDFVLSEPGAGFVPQLDGTDSTEGARFKDALRDWHNLAEATTAVAERPAPRRLDLDALTSTAVVAVDPQQTIPRRTLHAIDVPPRIRELLGEEFQEVMGYPVFDLPMYKPLANISSELFLPNVNLVEPNSITLLETNRKFIEAYIAGLNHEFARELLWREYVTDQRGSYFRQFWDVRSMFTAGPPSDELRESLRDVAELHRWARGTELGRHEARRVAGSREERVVLVIRGELLKKYPTAVIFAHHAAWQLRNDGSIDPAKERVLEPLDDAEEASPPPSKVRTPLYEAKVEPELYFFGFDLTAAEAIGGTGEDPDDPPGWFFVIKERPGEPRFGFDLERDASEPLATFGDLAWEDALPQGQPGDYVQAGSLAAVALQPPGPGEGEKQKQHEEDVLVNAANPSAARWASILFQAPVMVAIHAAEMFQRR